MHQLQAACVLTVVNVALSSSPRGICIVARSKQADAMDPRRVGKHHNLTRWLGARGPTDDEPARSSAHCTTT